MHIRSSLSSPSMSSPTMSSPAMSSPSMSSPPLSSPSISRPPLSSPAIHPCEVVRQCPVLQCPPLRCRPSLSSPAMSSPAISAFPDCIPSACVCNGVSTMKSHKLHKIRVSKHCCEDLHYKKNASHKFYTNFFAKNDLFGFPKVKLLHPTAPPRRLRRLDTRACGARPCPPFATPGSATECTRKLVSNFLKI